MSKNTLLGPAEKGSKFWMQKIPEAPLKEQMDMVLGDTLHWLSPLENDSYKEYQLNSPVIKAELGINSPIYRSAYDFWSTNQPMWDGIAVSEKSETLYLIEAKAHTKEPKSKCRGKGEGRKQIIQTMTGIHEKYFIKGVFDKWMTGQYQLANRLTFLQKMKDMKRPEYPNVKLIFINFINDYTLTPTSKDEWKDYYQQVFKVMTGSEAIPQDVIMIYHDVKHGTMVKEIAPK